ncbi:MAG: AMP-binding protein [Clostridia bacterium]|nr:AMP-binding protein [Clostridia bacterium]
MALDLDIWTVEKLGDYFGGRPDVTNISLREAIDKYTAEKLAETVEYAKASSPFYAEKIGDTGLENGAFEEIPFTTAEELRDREKDFLCVSPSQISRIVTLQTSGTTGKPKRIYFTEEDQQLTVDYFNHGMRLIVDDSDKVLILMPATSEGSVGLLLGKGLREMGAETIEYGVPTKDDIPEILRRIREEGVTSIVASPTHMIALARQAEKEMANGAEDIYLRSVLLSGEFVPDNTAMMLEDVFQCMVFEHYGMTEMGLGCAVACGYSRGYHIRETDLFIELINPLTGEVVPEEEGKNTPGFSNYGEIVFTTLTRKGMPFIRYRTGDFSRWILGDCPCGSSLKRLDKVVPGDGRMDKSANRGE